MGTIINWNGRQREVVKVKSDNPTHDGYFTTFRDMMKPGQVEFEEGQPAKAAEPEKPIEAAKTKKRKAR